MVLQQGKTTIQERQSRHTIGERRKRDIIAKGNIQRISLCPIYSRKQIRTIRRITIKKIKYGHGNLKLLPLRFTRTILNQVFDREVMF